VTKNNLIARLLGKDRQSLDTKKYKLGLFIFKIYLETHEIYFCNFFQSTYLCQVAIFIVCICENTVKLFVVSQKQGLGLVLV